MITVVVTGTPGSGKSLLVEKITQKLNESGISSKPIDLSSLIKENCLYDEFDPRFDTYLVDDKRVKDFLKGFLRNLGCLVCIIETHMLSSIPKELVQQIFILSCRTDVIYDRLLARGYKENKISENVECEIMRIIPEEAHQRFNSALISELSSNTEEDLADNIDNIVEFIANSINKDE